MRVVQLRRGRIVKFAAIGVFTLALLLLLINQFAPANFGRIGTDPLASAVVGAKDGNLQLSYPDDLPVFRGKGSFGNYEPSNSEKVTQFPTAITYIQKLDPTSASPPSPSPSVCQELLFYLQLYTQSQKKYTAAYPILNDVIYECTPSSLLHDCQTKKFRNIYFVRSSYAANILLMCNVIQKILLRGHS